MPIFSRLFRRARQQSRLEKFLSDLTPGAIRSASVRGRDEEIRIATAISLLVLSVSYRFASELADSASKLAQTINARRESPMAKSFDIASFEVAAFSHHALLEPFMTNSNNENEDVEDPYFVVLRSAAHLTSQILQEFTNFGLPNEFFVNRVLSYSLPGRRSRAATEFELILSSAIEGGSPKAGIRGPLSLNLGLGLALKTAIPGFFVHMIPALSVSARRAFENADELGLAD